MHRQSQTAARNPIEDEGIDAALKEKFEVVGIRRADVTAALFEGILQDPPWYGFLERLEAYLNCRHATLVLRMPRRGFPGVMVSTTQPQWGLNAFHKELFGPSIMEDLPTGVVQTLRQHFTPEALSASPYFTDFLGQLKIDDVICLKLRDPDSGMTFRLRCTRERGEPCFGIAEEQRLQALIPSVLTALTLYACIASQRYELSIYNDIASRLSIAFFLLDERGKVIKTNPAAERLTGDVGPFCVSRGMLTCIDHVDARQLHTAITRGLAHQDADSLCHEETITVSCADGKPWSVLSRSVLGTGSIEGQAPATIVLARRAGTAEDISVDILIQCFKFTKAEARLALCLARGLTTKEAAHELHVSLNTARCHLSALFVKTDCHRQPELISLILSQINSIWPTLNADADDLHARVTA